MGRPTSLRIRRRRSSRGETLVSVLVALLILGTCLASVGTIFIFCYQMTFTAKRMSVGYEAGRYAMERIKLVGFPSAREGDSVYRFNKAGLLVAADATDAEYIATATVTTSPSISSLPPPDNAQRTVVVVVRYIRTNEQLWSTRTVLVKGGI